MTKIVAWDLGHVGKAKSGILVERFRMSILWVSSKTMGKHRRCSGRMLMFESGVKEVARSRVKGIKKRQKVWLGNEAGLFFSGLRR